MMMYSMEDEAFGVAPVLGPLISVPEALESVNSVISERSRVGKEIQV